MATSDAISFIVGTLAAVVGVYITLETRHEKRVKKLMDNISNMIDTKIGEYANKVNNEKIQALERENDRLREYVRDKK